MNHGRPAVGTGVGIGRLFQLPHHLPHLIIGQDLPGPHRAAVTGNSDRYLFLTVAPPSPDRESSSSRSTPRQSPL